VCPHPPRPFLDRLIEGTDYTEEKGGVVLHDTAWEKILQNFATLAGYAAQLEECVMCYDAANQ
jgi:hypothetical protein